MHRRPTHPPKLRQALPAAILALVLLGSSAAPTFRKTTALPEDDVTRRTFDVRGPGRFHLDAHRGTVEVVVGDRQTVEVEVVRSPRRGRPLDDYTLSFEQQGNDVYVWGRFADRERYAGDGGNAYRVRYRIVLPRRFDAAITTAQGDVKVGDLDGELVVRNAAASVELGQIGGNVVVETSAGSIALAGAGGNAHLTTSAGSIRAGRVEGDLNARGSAGNIEVEGVGGTLSVSTTAGNVEATLLRAPHRATRLETSAGNIILRVPRGAGLVVDAAAQGGLVEIDLPRGSGGYARAPRGNAVHQTVGNGGPTITLRTTQGNIAVRQAS